MPTLSLHELKQVVGGEWLTDTPDDNAADCARVCDDSRAIRPGDLFVAIKGELSDGHRYIGAAIAAGARATVLQEPPPPEILSQAAAAKCPLLQVADSLAAYQRLALWHRRQFPKARVLAITGSCGKTSTKEMCAAILEQRWPGGVLKTIGSTNNHFGVPRNLYRIDETTRVAVIEMGTNHPGEIACLAAIAPPDVGLVCNIGHAHLEFFHDLRGVATEKGTLLQGILPDGPAIYPADAVGADILAQDAAGHPALTFGATPEADVQYIYKGYDQGAFRLRLVWKATGLALDVRWRIGGAHMAANAAAAAAAATALGLTPAEVKAGLEACVLPGQRLEIREIDGVRWVNDAFNANPDSTRAALDWMAEVAADAPKFLILGDMLELGETSAQSHLDILCHALKKCPGATIMTVGPRMKAAVEALGDGAIGNLPDAEAARVWLQSQPLQGAWILLKSSHGIGLAKLCP